MAVVAPVLFWIVMPAALKVLMLTVSEKYSVICDEPMVSPPVTTVVFMLRSNPVSTGRT